LQPHEGHRERLRGIYKNGGARALGAHGVLELLLCYAIPRRDVRPLAFRLINRFGSLSGVFSASEEELTGSGLVGENTAALIKLFGDLALDGDRRDDPGFVHTAEEAAELMKSYFEKNDKEQVCMICTAENGRVLFHGVVFVGDINSVRFRIRDVTEPAVLCGATRLYLAHNHPKGTAFASDADIDTTLRISDSLNSNSITLCEHMVFHGGEYGRIVESLAARGGKKIDEHDGDVHDAKL